MKKYKYICLTFVMTAILVAALAVMLKIQYAEEKQACFDTLSGYTSEIAADIGSDFNSDMAQLEFIAHILSYFESPNTPGPLEILKFPKGFKVISRLAILYPDNHVYLGSGAQLSAEGTLDFAKEAGLGSHISERSVSLEAPEQVVLRCFVPIVKDGSTIALLYGIVALDTLPDHYEINAFEDTTHIYLIDRSTGDFLMDTWHDALTNTKEMDNREAGEGYSLRNILDDLDTGKQGNAIFMSEKAGERFYCYYEPVGDSDWMVMLSVPESTALKQLRQMMTPFYILAAIVFGVLIIYFGWMLHVKHREGYENEQQLRRVQYMFDVEKMLFKGSTDPDGIREALDKVADIMTAEKAFLITMDSDGTAGRYLGGPGTNRLSENEFSRQLPRIRTIISENRRLLTYNIKEIFQFYPQMKESFEKLHIRNIALIPLVDLQDTLAGFLGTFNMKHRWTDMWPLDSVSVSFSTLINTQHNYKIIRDMSIVDGLTKVRNRNSYHSALADLAQAEAGALKSLAFIYFDANGLHEINNHLGHEAGDRMLQCLASEIMEVWDPKSIYRIGGDEFVVICLNISEAEVTGQTALISENVSNHGYEVSVGIEWRDTDFNVNAMLKIAEERMQNNKRLYYENSGNKRKIREMNRQLEQMITEKKDADTFLSVISSNFKGVYFVNLTEDSIRHIFIPEYFEVMLEQSGDRYSRAILLYAQAFISPEYLQPFKDFCDYDGLTDKLAGDDVPGICYKKKDEEWIRLQVFKFKRYERGDRETLWIFETVNGPVAPDGC